MSNYLQENTTMAFFITKKYSYQETFPSKQNLVLKNIF